MQKSDGQRHVLHKQQTTIIQPVRCFKNKKVMDKVFYRTNFKEKTALKSKF